MRLYADLHRVLGPFGCKEIQSVSTVDGPGNAVVVFWDEGDCMVACINLHSEEIIWCISAGGSTREAYSKDHLPPKWWEKPKSGCPACGYSHPPDGVCLA